jgi:hypothetical protein
MATPSIVLRGPDGHQHEFRQRLVFQHYRISGDNGLTVPVMLPRGYFCIFCLERRDDPAVATSQP